MWQYIIGAFAFSTFNTVAFAEESTPADSYQVPKGEQPEYGKKFYPGKVMGNPDERESGTYLELNPVLILKRGIQVEGEHRISDRITLGADAIFTGFKGSEGDVDVSARYFGVAPKIRFYPMEYLSGVFFGFKIYTGFIQWSVETQANAKTIKVSESSVMLAPCAHVGYRLVTGGKFTFAFYGGGGVNLPLPQFDKNLSSADADSLRTTAKKVSWDAAVKDLKDEYSFRPDIGITIGVLL